MLDAERAVFGPYLDGEKMRYGDPLAISRRLNQAAGGDVNRVIEDDRSEDPAVSGPAREKLLAAARFALEMVPFDILTGRGAQEGDIMAALRLFLEWVQKKSENTPPSLTYSTPMGQQVTLPPGSIPPPLPTRSAAVSNSTYRGCGCGEPGK